MSSPRVLPVSRAQLTLQQLELSPIEKFTKYGQFPYKFIIHLLLIVFTTVQLLQLADTASQYKKPVIDVFKFLLTGSTEAEFTTRIYTLTDFQQHLMNLTNTFSKLNENVFNTINTTSAEYQLEVYFSDFDVLRKDTPFVYNVDISKGIQQPFNVSNLTQLKRFVQGITKFNFNASKIISISTLNPSDPALCFNWTINLQYVFAALSHIESLLVMDSTFCQSEEINLNNPTRENPAFLRTNRRMLGSKSLSEGPFGNNLWLLHMIVLVLACCSLYHGWYQIYKMGVIYMHARAARSKNLYRRNESDDEFSTPWEELSFAQKIKFFNFSLGVIIVGNCSQIIGSAIALVEIRVPPTIVDVTMFNTKISLIGFGCMCAWMMIIYYLDYNESFQSTTRIIKSSSIAFIKFLVGVIPVYMAFVFLGRCLFWKYTKFESTNQAVVALFAIIAGDIIDETYTDTSGEGIISAIYLTTFIILFMGAVHNVIISIVSDGFKNKFLEERYQKLFNLYALGQSPKTGAIEAGSMPVLEEQESQKKTKKDPLSMLIPYLSQHIEGSLDEKFREKMETIEAEKNRILYLLNDRTQEIEDTLEKMKELVNYFLEEEQNKETKKKIKASYIKYLLSINYYIKKEIKEKVFAKGAESNLALQQVNSMKSPELRARPIEEEEEKKAQ